MERTGTYQAKRAVECKFRGSGNKIIGIHRVLSCWNESSEMTGERGMDQIFKDLGYHPEDCGLYLKTLGSH